MGIRLLSGIAAVGLTLAATIGTVGAQHCPDMDQDGVVTVADVKIVADHFGTFPGGPLNNAGLGWSARFDLNHDQRVDLADILRTAKRLGAVCSKAQRCDA
jgi:hypothetical protein